MNRRAGAFGKLNRCASCLVAVRAQGGMFGVDLVVGSLFLVVAHTSSAHSHARNNCSAAPLLRYGSQCLMARVKPHKQSFRRCGNIEAPVFCHRIVKYGDTHRPPRCTSPPCSYHIHALFWQMNPNSTKAALTFQHDFLDVSHSLVGCIVCPHHFSIPSVTL